MPDPMTPGSDDGNAGTPAVAPPIVADSTAAPPQIPSTTPADSQVQEVQQTLEPLPASPEEFRARLEAERKKTLDEYRAKAGAEGGWTRVLTEEDREFLKKNPWAIREMRAKIETYDKIIPSLNRQESPKTTEPDPLEQEAAELVRLAKTEDITPEQFYKGMASVTKRIATKAAEEVHRQNFQPSYQTMTRQQEEVVIQNDPRWQNPDVQDMTWGIISRSGGKVMPLAAFTKACEKFGASAPTNGNGNGTHAPASQPRVSPSFGETRTSSQPQATPSLSLAERFARTQGGKWLDGKL